MNPSYDLKHRTLIFRKRKIDIYFLASLSNDLLVSNVIEGIEEGIHKELINCINAGDTLKVSSSNKEKIDYALLSGNMIITDNKDTYILDTKKYPNRSIEQPDTEKSIRGAKDGFNESILNNTGLIRRRMKTMDLIFHLEKIGTENPCDIAVVYLESKVSKDTLTQVMTRLKQIKTEELIMSDRALEELLLNQGYNPYPLVR